MFTGIIDTTLSSTISMDIVFGLPDYYNTALVGLGLLLGFRYILSESYFWDEFLKTSLNIGTFPLLLSFGWIIIYSTFNSV